MGYWEKVFLHSLLVVALGWIIFTYTVRRIAAYILRWSRRKLSEKKAKRRQEAFIPSLNTFSESMLWFVKFSIKIFSILMSSIFCACAVVEPSMHIC